MHISERIAPDCILLNVGIVKIQHLCYYCCHVIIISTHEHINILVIEEYKFQLWVVMYINVINDGTLITNTSIGSYWPML
jgi:hypothetical protein